MIAQYIDSDDKIDLVSITSKFFGSLAHVLQKAFQSLLPAMIQVIGQSVEAGNETGARQLFDVLETLLILVS